MLASQLSSCLRTASQQLLPRSSLRHEQRWFGADHAFDECGLLCFVRGLWAICVRSLYVRTFCRASVVVQGCRIRNSRWGLFASLWSDCFCRRTFYWTLLTPRAHIVRTQHFAFRMLSKIGCGATHLLIAPFAQLPTALFRLLDDIACSSESEA